MRDDDSCRTCSAGRIRRPKSRRFPLKQARGRRLAAKVSRAPGSRYFGEYLRFSQNETMWLGSGRAGGVVPERALAAPVRDLVRRKRGTSRRRSAVEARWPSDFRRNRLKFCLKTRAGTRPAYKKSPSDHEFGPESADSGPKVVQSGHF